jgi:hypothetical protein
MTRKTSESRGSTPDTSAEVVTEVTLSFEGRSITTDWFHPDLEPVMCAICGKQCKEKGKPLCVVANPFCG